MSTYDPSSPEPEGGGQPPSDQRPPQPVPPANTPPPAPHGGGSPYDDTPPGAGPYQGTYGGSSDPYGTPGPTGGPGPSGAPGPSGPHNGGQYTPYQPPAYGDVPVAGMPPVGSWPSRILARLIDYVIIQVVAAVLVLPFTGFGSRNGWAGAVWLYYGLYLVYEGVMLARDGQTVGKKVMNVRVAMLADGSAPTGSAAWTRAAVFTLPAAICCGLWWLIDGVFGVFDKPFRQCVHDKAAKTVVVSTN
ncbi:RDD family protein [Streptomyces tateyamensis]|uniref:RDD family protein n=1 Tax=Streptomyces tateyamensis TaxID=565073 RepID=A0A2V4NVY5_9ACTN|nr:RDD family protein [Streptomyces tateyamensis]PYC84402.1 RDD family protein [Streptomyces tateyamensis]